VTIEQSRQLGRLIMAASGVSLAMFLAGVMRRSYMVLAIPVAVLAGGTAGLAFWVGYTMASTQWEDDDLGQWERSESETSPSSSEAGYGLRP
jgi:nitrogen fixation-related uncharacterized protein